MTVGQPQVVTREIDGVLSEPVEELTIDVPEEHVGAVTQLLALRKGRTSVVIAHRLSTVRRAQQIIVLVEGRIVERGTHEDLLALGGTYSDLYRTQFEIDDPA